MNTITLMDENGIPCRVSQQALLAALSQCKDFKLFGMDFHAILALRAAYHHRGGNMPITSSSVQEIFSK